MSFPQDGRMISMAVHVGDRIAAGQKLARVDPTHANAELRAARAA